MTIDLAKAIALHRQGDLAEAAPVYEAALRRSPRDPDILYHIGLCRLETGEWAEGARHMRALLKLEPRNGAAHHALGKALVLMGKAAAGRRHFETALECDAGLIDSRIELADLALEAGRLDRAESLYRDAVARHPSDARLWNNLGKVSRLQCRQGEARDAWMRAVALDGKLVEPRCNLALLEAREGRVGDGIAHLRDALVLNPDDAELHDHLGLLEFFRGRYEGAADALETATRLRPGFRRAEVHLAQARQYLCDWDGLDALMGAVRDEIDRAMARAPCQVSPFFALTLPVDEAARTAVAAAQARKREDAVAPLRPAMKFRFTAHEKDRLHVGYLSADWRDHPAAHLACGLFRHHDRARFEISVLSIGPDDGSDYLRRIRDGADRFVDLGAEDDRGAAHTIHRLGVDILLDVQGFMGAARPDILALRPSPIQVSYLTHLGSMGAGWLDYMIVDRVMVRPEDRAHYTEALVYMPHCYQVNDDEARIADPPPPRAAEGLPEDGMVYCAILGGHKITREIFAVWMRILKRAPGSVLWLAGGKRLGDNLRRAARDHGVDDGRLVFAGRVPDKADHLARLRLADLFLDAPIYGAHSSAVDCLWAGVPVLTRPGPVFSSRGAATLLTTLGLDELIADTFEDYEDIAVALGHDGEARRTLRERVAQRRGAAPLYGTADWVRDVERSYEEMWSIHCRGEAPRDIVPA